MKKLLSLVLAILILIPTLALAEVEGVTVSQFIDFFKENYPYFVATASSELFDRQLFIVSVGTYETRTAALGYSYKNSDIIEFVAAYDKISELIPFYLGAMSDADTVTNKLIYATSCIEAAILDIPSRDSNEWSRKNHFGHYYLELQNPWVDDGTIWMWLHEDSEQENKQVASTCIQADFYPKLEIELQFFDAPRETAAPANDTSSGITLSIGEWECPAHIAAGEYVVTPQKSAAIYVRRGDDLIVGEYLTTSDNDEIGRLVLQEGDKLEINNGKLLFTPFR